MNYLQYPKPQRLKIGDLIEGKEYISDEYQNFLLNGLVIMEEKMDGKLTFIELDEYVLWAEDLKYRHSIKYRVPARYALFDVYEKRSMMFLGREDKLDFCEGLKKGKYGKVPPVFPVPLVAKRMVEDINEIPDLVRESYYIDPESKDKYMEGLVIKQSMTLFYHEAISAKFVRKEFTEGITTNYLKEPLEKNIIDISVEILLEYPGAIRENDPFLNSGFYKEMTEIINRVKRKKYDD